MRWLMILIAGLALSGQATGTATAKKIRLAQTSTVTNCMMSCNARSANCQTACLVPGTAPAAAATTTSNATANTDCLLNCSAMQLACQTSCARQSPSQ